MTLSDQNVKSAGAARSAPPHHSVASRLRNYFLTGLILVGPLYITINLTWWFINWVDDAMRPFIPVGAAHRDLSAVPRAGLRPDHRAVRADAARLPHRQPGRPHVGRVRREPAQPHADRAADLQDHEADLRDAVLEDRLELPQGGAGGISGRHVVGGVPRSPPSAEIAARLPGSDYVSCFLPCTPNPTTGFFFYAPREQT